MIYKPTVIVKKYDKNIYKIVKNVLDSDQSFQNKIKLSKTIFIKPNLVTDKTEYIKNGANTSTELIEAVLRYLAKYNIKVYLGESETGTKVKGRKLDEALKNMGIMKLKETYDFNIVNLTYDKQIKVKVNGLFLKNINLGEKIVKADLIINMPKIKTHKYAVITCSLKNMFGVIPDPLRIIYHQNIHKVIADINKLFYKKMYIITDGIKCMEGQGPLYGNSRQLNIIMFSNDSTANDYVACKIMKIKTESVKHIYYSNLWRKLKFNDIVIKSYTEIDKITLKPFKLANKNLFVMVEGFLMQNRVIVKILFSDLFRRNITKRIRFLTDKLRGGSYTWYE